MHNNEPMEILQNAMKEYRDVNIVYGTVTAVYTESMSIDAYIPSNAGIMPGISLLSPTMSKDSRNVSMPKVNAPVVICTSTVGSRPFVLGAFLTPSQETLNPGKLNEVIYPGENEVTGGMAFTKHTRDGSLFLGGKYSNSCNTLSYGKNLSLSLENHQISVASNKKEGFSLQDINSETTDLLLNSKYTFYKKLETSCQTYKPEQVTDEIAGDVISVTNDIVNTIRGYANTNGFIEKIAEAQDIFKYYKDGRIEEKIVDIEALINNFILKPTGVKMELQIGTPSDDIKNIPSECLKSSQNNDIVAIVRLKDSDDNVIGDINIDETGNININMPKVYIDNSEVAVKPTPFVITATTTWNGTVAPYTQTITANGIKSTDRPRFRPVYNEINETAILERNAWNMIDDIKTGTDSIIITCFENKPTQSINIEVIV